MKKKPNTTRQPDLLPNYDFSKGERGKYAKRYAKGTNLILLEPDVAKHFPNADAVNAALRVLIDVARTNGPKKAGR